MVKIFEYRQIDTSMLDNSTVPLRKRLKEVFVQEEASQRSKNVRISRNLEKQKLDEKDEDDDDIEKDEADDHVIQEDEEEVETIFKVERGLEHKTEHSKILCVFKRNEMMHFVRSKTISIPDGTCGGYRETFRNEYELEILNIKENRLNHCGTISTCSKVQFAIKITDYTKKDYLACILTDKKWEITFWNLDDYKKDFNLSRKFINDRALMNLKKCESNGRDWYLYCKTSDKKLKVWKIATRKCVFTVPISSYYKIPLQIYLHYEDIILIYTGRREENFLRLDNLDKKTTITLSSQTDSIAICKFYTKQKEPFLATSGRDDYNIKIWNLTKQTLEKTLSGHDDVVTAVEFFNQNKITYLASASKENKLKIWDLEKYAIKNSLEIQSNVYELISIEVRNNIYLYSIDSREIKVWSDNVVRQLFKLQKKGYGTCAKPVFLNHNQNKNYKINSKEIRPGLPKDICMNIANYL